jgi:hypothetical protein
MYDATVCLRDVFASACHSDSAVLKASVKLGRPVRASVIIGRILQVIPGVEIPESLVKRTPTTDRGIVIIPEASRLVLVQATTMGGSASTEKFDYESRTPICKFANFSLFSLLKTIIPLIIITPCFLL